MSTRTTIQSLVATARNLLLGGGLLFAITCLFPAQAEAKKCPKGQYGVFKCIKCPKNTYAYKNHILTKLGCKKCQSGTYSKAGSRKCKDKACGLKAGTKWGNKVLSIRSGGKFCNLKNGFLYKCYRGKIKKSRTECQKKSCTAKRAGKTVTLVHGTKHCNSQDWNLYTCKYGTWAKQSVCPDAACVLVQGGVKVPYAHGKTLCSKKIKYKCRSTHWVKAGTCK